MRGKGSSACSTRSAVKQRCKKGGRGGHAAHAYEMCLTKGAQWCFCREAVESYFSFRVSKWGHLVYHSAWGETLWWMVDKKKNFESANWYPRKLIISSSEPNKVMTHGILNVWGNFLLARLKLFFKVTTIYLAAASFVLFRSELSEWVPACFWRIFPFCHSGRMFTGVR